MIIPVTHYGVHTTDEGVAYLHQGRSASNFIGLKAVSPFQISTKKSLPCPHLINQAAPIPDAVHWQAFSRILKDPLVQSLLPIPKEMGTLVPYLPDPQNELNLDLVTLSRMSSPIYPVVMPLRKLTKGQLMNELSLTNVCPLILTGVQPEDNAYLNEIAREAILYPRKLLLTGDPTVVIRYPMERIQTSIWNMDEAVLMGLPMESLGALMLRRHARSERLDAEITKGS